MGRAAGLVGRRQQRSLLGHARRCCRRALQPRAIQLAAVRVLAELPRRQLLHLAWALRHIHHQMDAGLRGGGRSRGKAGRAHGSGLAVAGRARGARVAPVSHRQASGLRLPMQRP